MPSYRHRHQGEPLASTIQTTDPTHDQIEKMVARLKGDFSLVCKHVLKIHTADADLVRFDPNQYQRYIYRCLAAGIRSLQIHKSRQLGNSTGIAGYLFPLTMFTPRHQCLVVANTFENSHGLWEIYDRFVTNMPKWLKDYMGVESIHMQIRFAHGGCIKFFTAGSDAPRGKTFQSAHFSEVAFWTDPDRTYSGAMGALSGSNPLIFLESTANGPNVWQQEWDLNPRYEKVFFTWVADKSLDVPERERTRTEAMPTPDHIRDLAAQHSLTDGQVRWAKDRYWGRCRGNRLLFRQEFPSTPEEAFITSGDRVFDMYFKLSSEVPEGTIVYEPPKQYTPYILGADPAGGGESGDYSAMCVLDVTDPSRPKMVMSYYDRASPLVFARMIRTVALKYKCLTVVERNNYGLPVLEWLNENSKGELNLYLETTVGKTGNKVKESLGFWTGEKSRSLLYATVIDFISSGRFVVNDLRMQHEINHLIWKGGRPTHDTGYHDDMLVCFGLALMGMQQSGNDHRQNLIFKAKPRGLDQIVQWQSATGKKVADHDGDFEGGEDDYLDWDEDADTLGDSVLGI